MKFRFYFVVALLTLHAAACEKILLFDANIAVHQNATLTVQEEITVQGCTNEIKRGIVREFPTKYVDAYGTKVNIDFSLKKVLMNGKPIKYSIEKVQNGVYIYIGDPEIYLAPGVYVFTIEYTVNRQLGFFDTHDELYWNVTGNGWRLPIDHVQARVTLPTGVDIAEIKLDGYTGSYGSQERALEADVTRNGVVRFKTTRSFAPFEGASIVVGWPKGYVQPPSFRQKLVWFLKDNAHYGIFFLALLLLMNLFAWVIRTNKRRKTTAPTIPLFYPPKDMSPGLLNYIEQKKYTDTALSAELVYMAVKGWLTIHSSDNYVWRNTYTLHAKEEPGEQDELMYRRLWKLLFATGPIFVVDEPRADEIMQMRTILQSAYAKKTPGIFEQNIDAKVGAFIIATVSYGALFFTGISVPMLIMFAGLLFLIAIIGWRLFSSYTKKGFETMREIEGFKLFLTVTEKDRIALVGTPPTESPQLYETYLPYAMALGVEQQWAKKFDAMFSRMKESGYTYIPIWYVGPQSQLISPGSFTSGFTQSLNSSISSAAGAPGSSSGFGGGRSGGGGFSGGGGGGGGGGGW